MESQNNSQSPRQEYTKSKKLQFCKNNIEKIAINKDLGNITKGKKNKNKKKIHIEKNTMSRARSKLKEQGISSNSNIIILKDTSDKLCFDFIRQHLPKSEANLDEKMQL